MKYKKNEALHGLKAAVSHEILHSPKNPTSPRLRSVLRPFIQALKYLVFWRRRINIKNLILLTANITLFNIMGSSIELQELANNLINLANKAAFLPIPHKPAVGPIKPLSPADKQKGDTPSSISKEPDKSHEIHPIINQEDEEYKEFYSKLRIAIKESLKTRKIDKALLNKLQSKAAKRAAEYILDLLLTELQKDRGSYTFTRSYNIDQQGKQYEISRMTLNHPKYKELQFSLDAFVDQILLIARLVDYITTNFKANEDVSILSIDSLSSIFNTYFAFALFKESAEKSRTQKLNLTILSDSLNQEDFEQIKSSLEPLNDSVKYYKKIDKLLNNQPHFDIYLTNLEEKFKKKEANAIRASDEKNSFNIFFPIFTNNPSQALAIVTADIPENERNALFGAFISKILKFDVIYNKANISEYKFNRVDIPFFWIPYIISKTSNIAKKTSQLFTINYSNSKSYDISLPIADWLDLLYELSWKLYPKSRNKLFFKFDRKTKKFIFIPYDSAKIKEIKLKRLT